MHVHNMGTPATSRPAQKSDSAAPQPAQAMPEFNQAVPENNRIPVKLQRFFGGWSKFHVW